MSLPVGTRVQWDAMRGNEPVVMTGEVVESQFSSWPSGWSLCMAQAINDRTISRPYRVEMRDENLRIIDAICSGCFERVRPGVNTDHTKGMPYRAEWNSIL